MADSLKKVILQKDIAAKVTEIAQKIESDYKDKDLLIIGVLKGAVIFMADLIREINLPLQMSFIAVSSYGSGTLSSRDVRLRFDVDISCEGKDILIVEDIVDTGNTLKFLKEHFKNKGAVDIKICTLLDKPSRRQVDIKVDYIGFKVEDKFLVGYGLDVDNKYRNLPDICELV